MNKNKQLNVSKYLKDSELLWDWYLGLNVESREFKSNGEEWSVNDVFRHFMLIEQMLVEQVKARLTSGKVKRAGFKNYRNAYLLFGALWIPKRYKAPIAVSRPNELIDFELEEWKKVRLNLLVLLSDFPMEQINGLVFKHPLAGPLRIGDAMRFLRFHLRHHFPQLRSLAKRGGFEVF